MRLLVVALLLVQSWAWGEQGSFVTRITHTLVENQGNLGGCMVHLEDSPATSAELTGLRCPTDRNWVTFSCTGVHTNKVNAERMFDSALMAFALNRRVKVYVDDEKKHGRYCYVFRLDVLREDDSD